MAEDETAPKLLAGGNPQIPKGHGDAPVQRYIAAMPGWTADVGRRIDTLIAREVPGAAKAVKWNSPLYGTEPDVWFLSLRVFARYVRITFFRGSSLIPPPPVGSRQPEIRSLDIHDGDAFEESLAGWVRQAASLPGTRL